MKKLAESTLATKSICLQTEYLRTRRTEINIHVVPVDISGDRLGAYFAQFSKVENVSTLVSKAGIATKDFVLM